MPGHPAQRNIYQLTRRRGLPWTPGLDAHIDRRGGELLGHGQLVLVDIDTPVAADGAPMVNALRWLTDRAVESGRGLTCPPPCRCARRATRTAGRLPRVAPVVPGRSCLPGAHGPAGALLAVELRGRGTCRGRLGMWFGPSRASCRSSRTGSPPWPGRPWPVTSTRTGHGSRGAQARLHGIIGRLLAAQRGERNRLLFWASLRIGELVAEGDLDAAAAGQALTDAAAQVGLVGEDGAARAVAGRRLQFGIPAHGSGV